MEIKSALIAFAEEWFLSNNIPVRRVVLPCSDYSWLDYGLRNVIMDNQAYGFFQRYFETVKKCTIYHLSDVFGCLYTIFIVPGTEELLVCGPMLLEGSAFSCPKDVAKRLNIPIEFIPVLQDYYAHFATLNFPMAYYRFFQSLGNHIWGQDVFCIVSDNLSDIADWYEIYRQNICLPESSSIKLHLIEERYTLEAQFMNALTKADERGALEIVSKLESGDAPLILSDELRNKKDLMIAGNTLCRKAAQTAGVHPTLIDACSNWHIQLIEQANSMEECRILFVQFVHNYYNLICQYSLKKYSILIKKVIAYIHWDLTSDLRLSAMSGQLNVSSGYLSSLFKREVGVSLTDYVNGLRIEQAKKLLLASDLPIKTIAQRCGIPDIYYFSRQFKKRTGCTPKAYRKKPL